MELKGGSKADIEISFPSTIGVDAIAAAGDQNLTERTVTVDLLAAATIVRVMLIADITVMNDTAVAHKIDLEVEGRVAAGTWVSQIDLAEVIGLPGANGATNGQTFALDVTDLVTASGAYGFRFVVSQSGGANNVRYTTQFVLKVTYRV